MSPYPTSNRVVVAVLVHGWQELGFAFCFLTGGARYCQHCSQGCRLWPWGSLSGGCCLLWSCCCFVWRCFPSQELFFRNPTPYVRWMPSLLFHTDVVLHSEGYAATILYYMIFYSVLLCYVMLYSILFYSILFYSILFYSILFYSILFYSILFYSILF